MKKIAVNEVWRDRQGKLIKVEWNACRCHPDHVTMTWGKKFKESGTYGKQNKSAWTKDLKGRGWVRMEREVIKWQ